jgi:hypothetical protein
MTYTYKALNMITLTIKKLSFFILLLALVQLAQAQVKIGDNPTVINKGSILELESTNKGLLFPRVNLINTTTWSLAASSTPVAGMMVYNSKTIAAGFSGSNTYPAVVGDGTGIYYWDGVGWVAAKGANGISGNSLYTGLTIPSATTGKDGDTYVDTVTGNVYTKIGGAWSITGNIKFTETITTLTKSTTNPGSYTYKNEAGANVTIKITQNGTGNPNTNGTAGAIAGDVYVDNVTGNIYAHNGKSWVSQAIQTGAGVPTGPGTPGAVYVNSTTGDIYTYNGTTNSWAKANEVTITDGINTKAAKIAGSNTTYKIDVATASGTTLGLVKEAATSPTVTINSSGELAVDLRSLNRVITTAVTYAALPNDNVILANATANDVTITLPVAAGQMGKRYIIKKFDTNEDFYVRVTGVAVGDIDGLIVPAKGLSTGLPYAGWELVSDGSKWQIINKF